MRTLLSFSFLSPLELVCTFNDKTVKKINLSTIANSEAFSFLKDASHINTAVNHEYFLEWQNHEADLSADTLWHMGVENDE
ncbi:MAG: DUF2442 domain-containing protein [Bacteroidetes bacterium]|nr:MAG: DUF2442 domain-containing protein [Bacteroidota bacterium]